MCTRERLYLYVYAFYMKHSPCLFVYSSSCAYSLRSCVCRMSATRSFKLVFLEENEEYITDVGCVVEIRSVSLPPFLKSVGPFRGRLRMGSHALYFDLEDVETLLKVQLGKLVGVHASNSPVVLDCSVLSSIPAVCVGGVTRLFKPILSVSGEFQITVTVHASLFSNVAPILESLFKFREKKDLRDRFVSAAIAANAAVPFDLTSLASHREVLLLGAPLPVIRIKKMLEINGLVQVSAKYVYFQAIPSLGGKKVKRFELARAHASHLLQYKLANTGIELSFANDKHLFVQFRSEADRAKFVAVLRAAGVVDTKSLPLDRITALWQKCAISNFDYLMFLNNLAGRSMNDIGQYPVMPWTISNWTAPVLDLENPNNYRNLSVPAAALNSGKLAQCRERAMHMPAEERFLFGSFYSNPAFVLYFLIRKFPECHLRLHGGHFDHQARLFTSLQTSWEAVAENGAAMMELIPEFFALEPDWLDNPKLAAVPPLTLPPWAHGDPVAFLTTMRASLESKHVSSQLHEWIDLVFGNKSRGKQICWNANNLFHPICYLTNTDIDAYCRETGTSREVVVLQSQEFGHVPKQLFEILHPKRTAHTQWTRGSTDMMDWKTAIENALREDENASKVDTSVPVNAPVPVDAPIPVASKASVDTLNIATAHKRFLKIKRTQWECNEGVTNAVFPTGTPVATTIGGYLVFSDSRLRLSTKPLVCVVHVGGDKFVCGDSVGFVFLADLKTGLIRQSGEIHTSSVTCIASMGGSRVVSGSRDRAVIVWDWETLEVHELLDLHAAAITAVCCRQTDGLLLSGDAAGVLCVGGRCLTAAGAAITSIALFDEKHALVVDGTLTVWDIDGRGSILWRHSPFGYTVLSAQGYEESVYVACTPNDDKQILPIVQSCKLSTTGPVCQFVVTSDLCLENGESFISEVFQPGKSGVVTGILSGPNGLHVAEIRHT